MKLQDFQDDGRKAVGREGDVIRFDNGHMVKLKNDWYVQLHKVFDKISSDRHIVKLILDEELDDIISVLPDKNREYVTEFSRQFANALSAKYNEIEKLVAHAKNFSDDRKTIATEFVPAIKNKRNVQLLFSALDGKDVRESLINMVRKASSTNKSWDEIAIWLR